MSLVGPSTPDSPKPPWRIYAFRIVIWLLIAGLIWISLREGFRLRRWIFDFADPIRFVDDINRGCYWGLVASGPEGYLNQYDKMGPELPDWQDSRWVPWLDYAPLRLLVMREWGAWLRGHWKELQQEYSLPDLNSDTSLDLWQRPYRFNEPVLFFNTTLEIFSALCAFFLTRHWVIRGSDGDNRSHFLGVWQGLVAALLIWFSLDLLISAHAWPQWDSWLIPWYLCACLLASLDWWFAAGLAFAIGAMFKAQMFTVCPIFIIWPLVAGKPGAAARILIGMILGIAAITSGWLITYLSADQLQHAQNIAERMRVSDYPPDLFAIRRIFDLPAVTWIVEMLLLVGIVPWLLRTLMPAAPATQPASRLKMILHSRRFWISSAALIIFAAVYWPWLLKSNRSTWYLGLIAGAAVAALALLVRRRNKFYLLAAIAGCGLFSCILLFHGSTAWWNCTVHYGTIHWPYMEMGPSANVPATFERRFGWPHEAEETAFTISAIHRHWPNFLIDQQLWPAADWYISAKLLFNTIATVLIVISGFAIGLQARRNDRRMLVALVTPWIMFFLWPVQIHERYLIYASGISACCIGNSVGTALLGLLLSTFSTIMQMHRLLDWHSTDLDAFGQNLSTAFPHLFSPTAGQTMLQYFSNTDPDMAWGILVIGMVFMYLSLTPTKRTSPRAKADIGFDLNPAHSRATILTEKSP